jgi:hypothetical protein
VGSPANPHEVRCWKSPGGDAICLLEQVQGSCSVATSGLEKRKSQQDWNHHRVLGTVVLCEERQGGLGPAVCVTLVTGVGIAKTGISQMPVRIGELVDAAGLLLQGGFESLFVVRNRSRGISAPDGLGRQAGLVLPLRGTGRGSQGTGRGSRGTGRGSRGTGRGSRGTAQDGAEAECADQGSPKRPRHEHDRQATRSRRQREPRARPWLEAMREWNHDASTRPTPWQHPWKAFEALVELHRAGVESHRDEIVPPYREDEIHPAARVVEPRKRLPR